MDQVYVDWGDFRRALRGQEREAFDGLFRRAKNHASASQLVAEPEPLHAILLSVALEHEAELARLRARVETLEQGPGAASAQGDPHDRDDG